MSKQKGFLQIFLFALLLIAGIILFFFARKQLNQKPAPQISKAPQVDASASIPQTTVKPTYKPTPGVTPSLLPIASSSASQSASISGVAK